VRVVDALFFKKTKSFAFFAYSRLVLCGLVLMLHSACATQSVLKPLDIAVSQSESALLVKQLLQLQSQNTFGRFLYEATLEYEGQSSRLRYAVVFDYPQNLRIELLPLNGFYTLGLFAASASGSLMVEPAEKRVTKALNPQALLAKYFYLPYSPATLIDFLSGRPALEDVRAESRITRSINNQEIEIRNLQGTAIYRLDPNLQLQRVQLFAPFSEALTIDAVFSAYQSSNGRPVPSHIKLQLLHIGAQLELKLVGSNMQRPPNAELFVPLVPEGYEVRER
jgi:hypothetical protein